MLDPIVCMLEMLFHLLRAGASSIFSSIFTKIMTWMNRVLIELVQGSVLGRFGLVLKTMLIMHEIIIIRDKLVLSFKLLRQLLSPKCKKT